MTFLTGLLMAIADSVPGVSGGTIAYIMKRYEDLFKHINAILKLDFNTESITFLIKLGIGWVIGFVSSVFVITSIFESHIYQISSLFLGFIIISIFIVSKQEREHLDYKQLSNTLLTIIGFIVVVVLVFFQNNGAISLSSESLNLGSYIYLFIVGSIAISAMLLPGISGSAVLMIFGAYFLIIESIHSFLTLDFSVLPILIVFGFGILFGAVGAVKTISHLFETKRTQMLHIIIGLLLGSIVAIINGPTAVEGQSLPMLSIDTFSIIFFLIGVGLIAILEFGISKEK